MKTVKIFCTMGYTGCTYSDIIEVPDDFDDEDITEEAFEAIKERLDWGWERVEGKDEV